MFVGGGQGVSEAADDAGGVYADFLKLPGAAVEINEAIGDSQADDFAGIEVVALSEFEYC